MGLHAYQQNMSIVEKSNFFKSGLRLSNSIEQHARHALGTDTWSREKWLPVYDRNFVELFRQARDRLSKRFVEMYTGGDAGVSDAEAECADPKALVAQTKNLKELVRQQSNEIEQLKLDKESLEASRSKLRWQKARLRKKTFSAAQGHAGAQR